MKTMWDGRCQWWDGRGTVHDNGGTVVGRFYTMVGRSWDNVGRSNPLNSLRTLEIKILMETHNILAPSFSYVDLNSPILNIFMFGKASLKIIHILTKYYCFYRLNHIFSKNVLHFLSTKIQCYQPCRS